MLDGTSKAAQPVLRLHNDNIAGVEVTGPPSSPTLHGKIEVSGSVLVSGIQVGAAGAAPGKLAVHIAQQSKLTNTGTIDTHAGITIISGGPGAVFVNDGMIASGDQTHYRGQTTINTPVTGFGTFQIGAANSEAALDFGSSVSKGISVNYAASLGLAVLGLSKPLQFLASINNFGSGEAHIVLPNTTVTSDAFANNHLKLFDNGALVANLNIFGDFQTSQFVLSAGFNGGTDITYNNNPAQAATPTVMAADHSVLPALEPK